MFPCPLLTRQGELCLDLKSGIHRLTGEVTGLLRDSHKSQDFIDFLNLLDGKYGQKLTIKMILDNHSAHKSKLVMDYLGTKPGRFQFTFTPVHSSWLNLVESFFYLDKEDANATTKVLKEAREVGLDMWTAMLSDDSFTMELIEDETVRHNISQVIQRLSPIYTEAERKKAIRISDTALRYLEERKIKAYPVKGVPEEFMLMSKDRIEIYIPLVVNTKNVKQKIQLVCGHAAMIRGTLYKQYPEYYIDTTVIVNRAITEEDRQLIETGNANYLFLNQEDIPLQ